MFELDNYCVASKPEENNFDYHYNKITIRVDRRTRRKKLKGMQYKTTWRDFEGSHDRDRLQTS